MIKFIFCPEKAFFPSVERRRCAWAAALGLLRLGCSARAGALRALHRWRSPEGVLARHTPQSRCFINVWPFFCHVKLFCCCLFCVVSGSRCSRCGLVLLFSWTVGHVCVHHPMAPLGGLSDGAEAVAAVELVRSKRAYQKPSRELRNWVVDYALLRLLQGWDHQTIAQLLSAWLPHMFSPWLSTRTVRRWLQDKNYEGHQPRDACDVLIPILREKCDRVGEAGVPSSARVMQPTFNRVAEQHA